MGTSFCSTVAVVTSGGGYWADRPLGGLLQPATSASPASSRSAAAEGNPARAGRLARSEISLNAEKERGEVFAGVMGAFPEKSASKDAQFKSVMPERTWLPGRYGLLAQ